MEAKEIINIIAIIVSPIVAVVVGQLLQKRSRIHADKVEIFKTLMISRGLGWSIESVKALNIIEVIFCDDKSVLNQWKIYYDKLCVEDPSETEMTKIKTEGDKLLEVIAKSLGYKEITWETIQRPYIPNGLKNNMSQQQQFMSDQLSVMNKMNEYMHHMNYTGVNHKDSQ